MPNLFQHRSFVLGRSGGIASTTPGNRGGYSANLGAAVTGHSVIAALNAKSDTAGSVIASPCGGGAQGVVCRAPGTNDASHVVVNTFNAGGALAGRAFYVAVV